MKKWPLRNVNSQISIRQEVVRENLPYPFVHYPEQYGTFFRFSESEGSPLVYCACSRPAMENLWRIQYGEKGERRRHGPSVPFVEKLCHRCNLVTPTLRYCHEMYGGEFVQHYGWYINQTFLRLGIDHTLGRLSDQVAYLTDVCPPDLVADILIYQETAQERTQDNIRLNQEAMPGAPERDREWWEQRLKDNRRVNRTAERAERVITRKVENIARQEFGFRKIGEGWVSETILHQLVTHILPDCEVLRHQRPEWMEGLELDIFVPSLMLALEYQGQQHFHAIEAWGGEKALKRLIERDKRKAQICRQLGIRLLTVSYFDPLTEGFVRKLLAGKHKG